MNILTLKGGQLIKTQKYKNPPNPKNVFIFSLSLASPFPSFRLFSPDSIRRPTLAIKHSITQAITD